MNRLAAWLVVSALFVLGAAGVGCGKYGPPERTLPPEVVLDDAGAVPPEQNPNMPDLEEMEGGPSIERDEDESELMP